MAKKKQLNIDDLARMMKKGFDAVTGQFGEVTGEFRKTNSLITLTRQEMAKDEDLQAVKNTVNSLFPPDQLGLPVSPPLMGRAGGG